MSAVLQSHGRERLGLDLETGARLGEVRHTLTHMKLSLELWAVAAVREPSLGSGGYTGLAWVTPEEADGMGISTLARKALAALANT